MVHRELNREGKFRHKYGNASVKPSTFVFDFYIHLLIWPSKMPMEFNVNCYIYSYYVRTQRLYADTLTVN